MTLYQQLIDSRGAGGSGGKTSWTAKGELADYISFAGFFIHYLQSLTPRQIEPVAVSEDAMSETTLTPIPSAVLLPPPLHHNGESGKPRVSLILGGYSYGSLITSRLAPTSEILKRLADAAEGSAGAEIKLRASRLANEWNLEEQQRVQEAANALGGRRRPSHSIIIGGEESEPGTRRSHETRRSIDSFRRSVDVSRKALTRSWRRDRTSFQSQTALGEGGGLLFDIQTSYLLISPLLPPIAALATMFTTIGHHDGCDNLVQNPSLAIYGEKDGFTASKKIARWAEQLSQRPGSRFQARQILQAGHFWHEQGVMQQLVTCVENFLDDVLRI